MEPQVSLLKQFTQREFNISKLKEEYELKTGSSVTDDCGPVSNPLTLEADLKHYKELFSKLKFSYLEQDSKEKFLRAILDDPPLVVDSSDISQLEDNNVILKNTLKSTKNEVQALLETVSLAAREVASDYMGMNEQVISAIKLSEETQVIENEIQNDFGDVKEDFSEFNMSIPEAREALERMNLDLIAAEKSFTENQRIIKELELENQKIMTDLNQSRVRLNEELDLVEKSRVLRESEEKKGKSYKQVARWYDAIQKLYTELADIEELSLSDDVVTFNMKSTDSHAIQVKLTYKNDRLIDADIQCGKSMRYELEDAIKYAKARNDTKFLLLEIKSRIGRNV